VHGSRIKESFNYIQVKSYLEKLGASYVSLWLDLIILNEFSYSNFRDRSINAEVFKKFPLLCNQKYSFSLLQNPEFRSFPDPLESGLHIDDLNLFEFYPPVYVSVSQEASALQVFQ
jgi:hypothetical protein